MISLDVKSSALGVGKIIILTGKATCDCWIVTNCPKTAGGNNGYIHSGSDQW